MKILSLGDSIGVGYRDYLREFLNDTEVLTKEGEGEALKDLNIPTGANCGDSGMLFRYLELEDRKGALKGFDAVMFNCGLHDIKWYTNLKRNQVGREDYEENLKKTIKLLKNAGIKYMAFINSTPVYDEIHNPLYLDDSKIQVFRSGEELSAYNNIAQRVMDAERIPVIDLYSFSVSMGKGAICDHVHYHPENSRLQAAYIAGAFRMLVKGR
jgi:lysophospholipase L1-like esterase